jgi:hypothetical protein
MSPSSSTNKFLRILGIVVLSLTVLMTLMGGVGTTCVAFGAEKWGSMAALVPVKPVFQVLVVVSILAGLWGLVSTIRLARRQPNAYWHVLMFLLVAGVASAIQYYFSLTLRGKTAPNNMRLYLTVIALVLFLVYRLPGIWGKTGFTGSAGGAGGSGRLAGGIALMLCGAMTLTAPLWAGPSHMVGGFNTVEVLLGHLLGAGAGMLLGGAALLAWPLLVRKPVQSRRGVERARLA